MRWPFLWLRIPGLSWAARAGHVMWCQRQHPRAPVRFALCEGSSSFRGSTQCTSGASRPPPTPENSAA